MSAPALTPALVAAFRRVAEAGGDYHPPPGEEGKRLGDALWRLEALGLVQWLGERKGWRLTPAGEAKRPELGVWRADGR